MKTATLILGAVIILLFIPSAMDSIDDFRTTEQVDAYDITTGGGVTTANVTLSQELFGDETRNASVSSNMTVDAPIASSYVSNTQALNVIGLEASTERRLTVTYAIDALDDYPGAGVAARVWPILLILGVIGIIVAAVYNATQKGD